MSDFKSEIAAQAAAAIVEDGLDYQSAKRRAYEALTGHRGSHVRHEALPSNDQVQAAIREHLALYEPQAHPERLRARQSSALRLMALLQPFEPWLMGALAEGLALPHSGLQLACVGESAKEMGIELLNHGLDAEATELPNPVGPGLVEALQFEWEDLPTTIRIVPRASGLRNLGGLQWSELQDRLKGD
ncbi:MAG: hypothetical protein RL483_999 [Pseudomonadota bacterium]|jgi:hypothetical protein